MLSWIPCKNENCYRSKECYRFRILDEDCIGRDRITLLQSCKSVNYSLFVKIIEQKVKEIVEVLPEVERVSDEVIQKEGGDDVH